MGFGIIWISFVSKIPVYVFQRDSVSSTSSGGPVSGMSRRANMGIVHKWQCLVKQAQEKAAECAHHRPHHHHHHHHHGTPTPAKQCSRISGRERSPNPASRRGSNIGASNTSLASEASRDSRRDNR